MKHCVLSIAHIYKFSAAAELCNQKTKFINQCKKHPTWYIMDNKIKSYNLKREIRPKLNGEKGPYCSSSHVDQSPCVLPTQAATANLHSMILLENRWKMKILKGTWLLNHSGVEPEYSVRIGWIPLLLMVSAAMVFIQFSQNMVLNTQYNDSFLLW